MSHHQRRILTPGASRKRKEREALYGFQPSAQAAVVEPKSSNRLLAGYMAFEFLTKGTLFGEKFDPARAEAVPLSGGSKKTKPEGEPKLKKEQSQGYAEVASILKSDGTHIPGIVNPTELARWIQM
ncbi:hypothetical protein CFOL_v3_12754 [Cephalotus follicularis]|uniref:Embryo sac development arrest 6 n=1 Tax=Cephalotus follicularis TaxID=3775 RepID=A0A1Q3BNH3_CEPFO|nr:hypothetical protein CFOL_v3_12754 [Cephalotus follicularis]